MLNLFKPKKTGNLHMRITTDNKVTIHIINEDKTETKLEEWPNYKSFLSNSPYSHIRKQI